MDHLLQGITICLASGALVFRRTPALQVLIGVVLILIFVDLYTYTPESVAQDRYAYYSWYRSTTNSLTVLETDFLFTELLRMFPDRLSPTEFHVMFISVLMLTLLAFHLRAQQRFHGHLELFALILVAVLLDRVLVGLMFNTSRSTLAGLLFCFVFLTHNWAIRLLFFFVSANVHLGLFAIMLPLYVVAFVLKKAKIYKYLLAIGLTIFLLKIFLNIRPLSVTALQSLTELAKDSRLERGFQIAVEGISSSLAVQFFLIAVLPVILVLSQSFSWVQSPTQGSIMKSVQQIPSVDQSELWLVSRFWVLTLCTFFLAYPDIQLSLRLVIIPAILSPLLLNQTQLAGLVVIKSAVFVLILPSLL